MLISDIYKVVPSCIGTNISIMLCGIHGIGKSEIIRDVAEQHDMHCETLMLAEMDVSDVLGMPYDSEMDGQKVTRWSPPDWILRILEANKNGKRSILFLDELNRANIDTRQTALQLALERRVHSHILPKDTLVISAINPSGLYQVQKLDTALLDRFLYLDVTVDFDGWVKWARKKKINNAIIDFLVESPKYLHTMDASDKAAKSNDQITASPRSWVFLNEILESPIKLPKEVLLEVICGFVGKGVGLTFFSYYNEYHKVIKIEDIENYLEPLAITPSTNFIELGQQLKDELLNQIESVTAMELCNKMLYKYMPTLTFDNAKYILAVLYTLNIETLTSVLKSWKADEDNKIVEAYINIMKMDPNIYLASTIRKLTLNK